MRVKRLYISVIGMMLLFVTLGTVTFAWISLSTINNIEGLSLSASGGDELMVSLDGINYYANLEAEQLYALVDDIKLVDVTSTDGLYFETGGLRDVEEAIPNEHYLSFDLYLRSTVNEHHVYLIDNLSNEVSYDTSAPGTYVTSQGVMWTAKYDFWNGPEDTDKVLKGDEDLYYAKDSIRIAITDLVDDTNPLDTRRQNELNTFIFDPSGDETRGYGLPYGQYSYFVARTNYYIGLPQEKPSVNYELTETDPLNPYQALSNTSLVTVLQDTNLVTESGKTIKQGKIRINIWIEGWDADAFDAIENDRIKIQLYLKALMPYES